ncbi:hypothetical protein [Poritiphilus flavus]|uniref:Uncharacterized protein n=1 Tax=Poritiphilus flavus TaxID=2697053 RepID=A0A6L9EG62_9FLAO|nr:hypothetical protein [Poritiphilus flavus]NAS13239.1 hypothetical protein [Poritiphilus flavus]
MKPRFAGILALCMAFYYLISPLHQQIGGIVHQISHGLEAPHTVIVHDMDQKEHAYQMHRVGQAADHEHAFIDFFQTLLEGSDWNDFPPSESLEFTLKLDKHFTKQAFYFASSNLIQPDSVNSYLSSELLSGFPFSIFYPPQNS